jgi:hypothetical protein
MQQPDTRILLPYGRGRAPARDLFAQPLGTHVLPPHAVPLHGVGLAEIATHHLLTRLEP